MLKHSPVPRRLARHAKALSRRAAETTAAKAGVVPTPEPELQPSPPPAYVPKSIAASERGELPDYNKRMMPLSLKFTGVQMQRLLAARQKTGRMQTELIRNAVDMYLKHLGV